MRMSDADRIATLEEALRTLSDSEHELQRQNQGLTHSLGLAEERVKRWQAKCENQNAAAPESDAVRRCLDVWEKHCWAGKAKPKSGPNGPRIARIRKAFEWGFEESDICDAFRGLGLLPYRDKYNERSKALKPGFYRASDVKEALCEEARLERFRDYYRRVQASPVERRRELWWQTLTVADTAYEALASEVAWERYAAGANRLTTGDPAEWEIDAVERAMRSTLELFGTLDGDVRIAARLAVRALDDVRFRDECSRRPHQEIPEAPQGRPQLRLIEGEAA
jgi:hypothetical protein